MILHDVIAKSRLHYPDNWEAENATFIAMMTSTEAARFINNTHLDYCTAQIEKENRYAINIKTAALIYEAAKAVFLANPHLRMIFDIEGACAQLGVTDTAHTCENAIEYLICYLRRSIDPEENASLCNIECVGYALMLIEKLGIKNHEIIKYFGTLCHDNDALIQALIAKSFADCPPELLRLNA